MGGLQTLSVMPWEAAIAILNSGPRKNYLWFDDYRIKRDSARYDLFMDNNTCVCCGTVGSVARLEYNTGSKLKTAHFNLYDESGLLFTKDHIRAKSMGGQDSLSNYQTMCARCNNAKGSMSSEEFDMQKPALVRMGRLLRSALTYIDPNKKPGTPPPKKRTPSKKERREFERLKKEEKKTEQREMNRLSLRFWSSTELLRCVTLGWNFDKPYRFEREFKNAKNWNLIAFHFLWFSLLFSYTTE